MLTWTYMYIYILSLTVKENTSLNCLLYTLHKNTYQQETYSYKLNISKIGNYNK